MNQSAAVATRTSSLAGGKTLGRILARLVRRDVAVESIPSMGGREIGPLLRQFAREAPANSSVVEVGCWLGAGTIQLALGIREGAGSDSVQLHCYDRWQANAPEVEKAARQGLRLTEGEDLLPHVKRVLDAIGATIQYNKGDIRQARWHDGPISFYVDDASKTPKLFYHALTTFGPHWIRGVTKIVLMDYDIWKKTGDERHECQKEFIQENQDCFEPIVNEFDQAVFLYVKPVNFSRWLESKGYVQVNWANHELVDIRSAIQWLDSKGYLLAGGCSLEAGADPVRARAEWQARDKELRKQLASAQKRCGVLEAKRSDVDEARRESQARENELRKQLAELQKERDALERKLIAAEAKLGIQEPTQKAELRKPES
jgi:hypothetical protein